MKHVLLALALAGLLAGCNTPGSQAQEDAEQTQAADAQVDDRTVTADENEGRLDQELIAAEQNVQEQGLEQLDDPKAAQKAYTGNLAEIELAALALEKSQDQEVQDLANTIRQDHQKANDELQALSSELNVQFDEQLEPKHEQLKEKLSQLSGEEFDKEYVQAQVEEHQKVLKFYEQEAENSQNQQLQSYFKETMPVIANHLEKANEIKAGSDTAN